MYLGSLVEVAGSGDIFENPLHPYTKSLDPPSGYKFRTRCPDATGICPEQEPRFTQALPGHFASCHLLFQPTLPQGERRGSTHERWTYLFGFNPRSRTGSDQRVSGSSSIHVRFQPTPPHGERRTIPRCPLRVPRFNPRSRTGSDGLDGHIRHPLSGFNPRSRTGSDSHAAVSSAKTHGFNPRSRTGSDTKAHRRFF